MADWAYNPLHGWAPGPYDAINCEYPFLQDLSFSYLAQPSYSFDQSVNGFFPAPPGLQWVDLSAGPGLMMSPGGCSGRSEERRVGKECPV